jgi:hypothetical protein
VYLFTPGLSAPTNNRIIRKAYDERTKWYLGGMGVLLIRNLMLHREIKDDFRCKPSLLTKEALKLVNYNFHGPRRKSQIVLDDDILIFHKPIARSGSYTRLPLVPRGLRNIVFVTFHTNPVGGHLDAVRTMHRSRLHFYPGMYSYVVKMCDACPDCALANPT